jgi:hypothetical protein
VVPLFFLDSFFSYALAGYWRCTKTRSEKQCGASEVEGGGGEGGGF